MKKFFIPLLLVSFAGANYSCSNSAKIMEQKKAMTTYPFSDPNPIANPSLSIYPYFRFDGYTSKSEEKEWNVVELENEYIKVTILPEIGGKIWGAMEKSSGENYIYHNDVVKFRDIAMRGAWTSGGVEINFGIIGHAPWTATPVDYKILKNNDGSVSCFVGTLDLLTRAWWSCEIKLEKDKAYFTTSTKWYNPSLISSPYYQWMNAGYNMTEDMEYYFPGDAYIGHEGDAHSWPKDGEGHNLAKYSENNFGSAKSYHVLGGVADYYATYWHGKDFGSVHHSSFDDKLGMKIFLWGLSREGMIWEDLLTEKSGQYVELQSGRLFNQESPGSANTPFKHFKHTPVACEKFTEYWYPIKGTKGVTTTNKYATINIAKEGDQNKIYISPLQKLDDILTVECDGKEVYSKKISLNPMENFNDVIDGNLTDDISITLGNNLIKYTKESNQSTSRPKEIEKSFDQNSLYGKYVMGCQSMNIKKYSKARELFDEVLTQDPNYSPALNALGSIDFTEGKYSDAKQKALRSLSIDTYDADANILYGVSSSYLNNSTDAIDGYSVAALSATHRPAAYLGLAKEYAKRNEWTKVIEYAEKLNDATQFNSDAYQLLSVAYRNNNENGKAKDALNTLYKEFPLNHFVNFEKYLSNEISAANFKDNITSELPHEIFTEMGLWYESIGNYEDALKLYEIAGENPIILYRKAFVLNKLGKEFKEVLAQANSGSPMFVMPSRHESLELFRWAKDNSDNNCWKVDYYLALTLWSLGDQNTALSIMNSLGDKPDYAPFYISRAQLKNGSEKIDDLLRSEKLDKNWRVGSMLISEYKAQQNKERMIEVAQEYKKAFGDDFRLGIAYIPVLMENGKYQEAIDYLEGVEIIPYEGAIEGRTMYRDCYLLLALEAINSKNYDEALKLIDKSTVWIENLGVGKPYDDDIDSRTENYMRAYCYLQKGDKSKADELFNIVANSSSMYNSNTILSVLALKKQGDLNKATKLLDEYQGYNNNAAIAKWAKLIFEGNKSAADNIIKNSDLKSNVGPFGANNFKDFGFINLVKYVVEL